MAGSVLATPGFDLTPSSSQVPLATNYITDFNFLTQYLPDTYEKEFERYGNRTISSFLRLVGAEMPCISDQIKWAEQGRLHTKYTRVGVDSGGGAAAGDPTAVLQVNDSAYPASGAQTTIGSTAAGTAYDANNGISVRVGQTVMITFNNGAGSNKAIVTAVDLANDQFTVAFYENTGLAVAPAGVAAAQCTVFIYGSEFQKGTPGMVGSLEAADYIFENNPIILKDTYAVNGSDMAQIGWIEVTTENGATGYLWYLKSEHETRLRFDDYLETSMIEAVPAVAGAGGGAKAQGFMSSEGIFHAVNNRGNVWGGGNPTVLADWDAVIGRLDNQGAIEENVVFVDRNFGFDIDDMLAAQNSYGGGGTSYGLFDNDEEMALNLGFTGFRRGYDFYKSDWKYLNDPTMRGGLPTGAGSGRINGLLVPAGSTTVYDQILGKNAKRPFLHVRYRASETEDRRYKSWITGSAGGVRTSDIDEMQVNFLSERAVCTMGANNFFLFQE